MKVKSPHETAGPFGKHHAHLGHFTKKEHINRGHNDGPKIGKQSARTSYPISERQLTQEEHAAGNEEADLRDYEREGREAENEKKREYQRGGKTIYHSLTKEDIESQRGIK